MATEGDILKALEELEERSHSKHPDIAWELRIRENVWEALLIGTLGAPKPVRYHLRLNGRWCPVVLDDDIPERESTRDGRATGEFMSEVRLVERLVPAGTTEEKGD